MSIKLLNGSTLVGCVASYKRGVKTANLADSITEIKAATKEREPRLLSSALRDVYARLESSALSNNATRRITASAGSQITLNDATVICRRRSFKVSKVELHERWVVTLSPLPSEFNTILNKNKSPKVAPSAPQLKHMILQQPCDSIKNAAFLRCNRIGQNRQK